MPKKANDRVATARLVQRRAVAEVEVVLGDVGAAIRKASRFGGFGGRAMSFADGGRHTPQQPENRASGEAEDMRKVVVYTLFSVDGVAEAPETFVLDFDKVMEANLTEVIETQDVVLLGRVMYDEWANYWPDSNDQPFADFINGVRKYVATSTPLTTDWTNAEAIQDPFDDFVRDLRSGQGGDIGVHGSISLVQSLLTAGLVDELHLVIAPSVVGSGRRLFVNELTARRLELIRSTGTPSGSLLVSYRVTTDD